MSVFRARWCRERRAGGASMLTPGALRQRRRRALESAEERRERLARDAERKRMKRLSESAEEAAWRRTVDALRKKEKRLKERETKALVGQGNGTAERSISKADFDSDVDSIITRVVRPFPRRRRSRHMSGATDYLLSSFPEGMADVSEFGGSCLATSILCDVVGAVPASSIPSTSRAPYSGALCCPSSGDGLVGRAHCLSTDVDAMVGCDFPNVSAPASKTLFTSRAPPQLPGAMPKRYSRRGLPQHGTLPTPPVMWGSDAVVPLGCRGVVGRGGKAVGSSSSGCAREQSKAEEELLDVCQDESLSAFSPEVIISEVKPEPSEEDGEDQPSVDESIRQAAALSVLSPEVIIREVKAGPPPGTNHGRRVPMLGEDSFQQPRGQWGPAFPVLGVGALSAEDGHSGSAGTAIYTGRTRGQYLVGV